MVSSSIKLTRRIRYFLPFILVALFFVIPNQAEAKRPANVDKYINENKAAAIEVGKKYGIFPSQILAQGGFESTWGTSSVARNNNNFYGIKGSGAYRKYATARDCMEDFAINFYVTKLKSYEQIIKANSPYGIGKLLYIDYAPPGDGTNAEYLTSYESIVANYDVVQYDKIAFPDGIKRHPKIEEVRAGKKDNFTYEEAGKIDYSGKDVVVTDTDVKVDGTTEQKVETPNPNGGAPTENVVIQPKFTFSEDAIKGMPKKRDWEEEKLPEAKKSELNAMEQRSLENWKKESDTPISDKVTKGFRTAVSLSGIILFFYGALIIIAYIFDRITITEWKALPTITRNRLFAVKDKEDSSYHLSSPQEGSKGITIADLCKVQFFIIGLAMCLLNGWIYTFVDVLIRGFANAQSYISGLF
ncbi:glucosaminidase domain-containing protein [Bacillus cereus]|uniref:glucosaminidase domain-containing protein n=1 Tax=Bacillus cereus TaxID=1396 RepID=UPI003D17BA8B